MKKLILATAVLSTLSFGAFADDHDSAMKEHNYTIDTKGAHASINFKVNHLGYSWLRGRFDDFEGSFYYDPENPEISNITVSINTNSVNSNHAERDKHLRNDDFLDVENYPEATYVGTYYEPTGENTGVIHGDLTLHGVTNHLMINVEKVGMGEDPWGGERVGFTGTTEFKMSDFGIDYDLGEASQTVHMQLDIEGVKQQ